ncbi:MAG: lipopolysaccharide biosynthesis protein [Thiogranum sp.]
MLRRIFAAIPHRKRLMSGAAWAMGMRILASLVSVAVSGLLARLLAPGEMGTYFLMFSIVMVAIIFSQLGFNRAAVRAVAQAIGLGQKARAYHAIVSVLRHGVIGAVIVGALLYFGLGQWMAEQWFESPVMAGSIGLLALWVMVLTLQSLLQEIFRGFSDIRSAAAFGNLIPLAITAALLWWLLESRGHSSLGEVLWVTVAASAASILAAGLILAPRVRALRVADPAPEEEPLRIAWPLIASSLLFVILQRADVWVMGMFRPDDEVAIYGAAARLILLINMPMTILGAVLPPIIAELHAQEDYVRLQRIMRFTATISALPATILLAVFIFFGDTVLELVFGEFYAAGKWVLILLSLGQLGNVWAGGTHHLLLMAGRDRALLVINIVCLALAIGVAWLTVEPWGMVGVAAAFGGAVLLRNLIMPVYCYRQFGIKTFVRFSLRPPEGMRLPGGPGGGGGPRPGPGGRGPGPGGRRRPGGPAAGAGSVAAGEAKSAHSPASAPGAGTSIARQDSEEPIDVIFIAGSPRCGSTILDRVLGTLDGVASFNELNRLFRSRVSKEELCACGRSFQDCEFWDAVMDRVITDPEDVRRIEFLNYQVAQMRHFPRLYTGRQGGRYRHQLEEYRQWLGRLYTALAEVSGKRIIVDSSKVPSRALILAGIPGVRVHVVHVVRDVRAVAYSWQKQKFDPTTGQMMLRFSPRRVLHMWYTHNVFSDLLARRLPYTRVNYERFAQQPRTVLQELVNQIPVLADRKLTFEDEHSITLPGLHSIGGNPDRFRVGSTRIRLDSAWVQGLDASTARWLGILAYPMLVKYGYTRELSPQVLATASGAG